MTEEWKTARATVGKEKDHRKAGSRRFAASVGGKLKKTTSWNSHTPTEKQ